MFWVHDFQMSFDLSGDSQVSLGVNDLAHEAFLGLLDVSDHKRPSSQTHPDTVGHIH